MLKSIHVHNFRSLDHFGLEIQPGLNVLVGPNGAGKTSIMKWFEFLSFLATSSLREAIGKIGGASHVFRRKNGRYTNTLEFQLFGDTRISQPFTADEDDNEILSWMHYEYYGEISMIDNQIFFSKQISKVWITSDEKTRKPKTSPNVNVNWSYDVITDKVECDIKTRKPRRRTRQEDRAFGFFFQNTEIYQDFLTHKTSTEHFVSPNIFFPVDFLHNMKSDLNFQKAFNIAPNNVRSTLDISSQSGVQYDGSGVASTLYDLRADMEQNVSSRYRVMRRSNKGTYPTFLKVIDYFKLSDENINSVSIDIENFRNEFVFEVEYKDSDDTYKVPMALLSDGTVKWLAIVTALATERQSLFIEEPENFLHPRLQEGVVEIIREEVLSSSVERFALITTHSETLLNKLRPEEIIITSMDYGRTVSERIADPKQISKIIAESGFGLGYFYVSGGF